MTSRKSIGRVVGALLLVHLAVGLMVPFILLDRMRKPAGLLAGAAANPGEMRAAVLLLFVGSAVAIGITAAAWSIFRRYSSGMALWLLALAVVGVSLQAVDNAGLLTMLSLSQEYASADAAKGEHLQTLSLVVGSARRWVHYSALLFAVSWIFLFCSILYRFRLVPRVLAAFGLIGSVLQITGVTLRGFLGYPPETRLAMPLAPAYVALAVWLLVKDFGGRDLYRETEAPAVGNYDDTFTRSWK